MGKQWMIPKDAEYPEDNRVKSGDYRNWRKRTDIWSNNPELMKTLHEMCVSLSKIYGDYLDKVILYGSYARGEQTSESDADVAVILREGNTEDMHDKMIDAVVDFELSCGITISIVPLENEHFNEWKATLPYYRNIEKEGIVLWKAS